MGGRPYHEERDLAAVTRIWREVGWIDDDSDAHAAALRTFLSCGDTVVADVAGSAECAVHRSPGSMLVGSTDLPLSAITAVTTSHVGRRQGLATDLMLEALAGGHADGAAIAGLGIFDQGFYDRFGFGTGTYEHTYEIDPSTLTVPVPARPPIRVTVDDAREVHELLARRRRSHGGVVLDPPELVVSELAWLEKPIGLGFRDADGRLTSVVFGSMLDEYGPYRFEWFIHEEPHQVLDLLGVVRSLGDQVATAQIAEPVSVQLQDVVREPFRQARIRRHAGRAGSLNGSTAWRQFRIVDLGAVVAAVDAVADLAFGLRLHDPLADLGGPWRGIAGEHTIELGSSPSVRAGLAAGVPVVDASVGACTRLLLGTRPATSLALTDRLSGPPDLLGALDEAIRLRPLDAGWSF